MNNKNTALLFKWIEKNSKNIDLKLFNFDNIKELSPFKVSLASANINGQTIYGSGIDNSSSQSILLSFAELLERLIFKNTNLDPTSNGVAVHTNLEKCKTNAACELLERDSFFTHYLTRTPFKDCTDEMVLADKIIQGSINQFLKSGITIRIGEVRSLNDTYSFATTIFFNKKNKLKIDEGVAIGLGCSNIRSNAASKSFKEALKGAIPLFTHHPSFAPMQVIDFYEHFTNIEDHKKVSLSSRAIDVMSNLYTNNDFQKKELETVDINIKLLILPDVLKNCPIHAAYASSDMIQNAYFGPLKEEYVNLERLRRFAGRDLTFIDLENYPHPLS